ncbi:hypothetical protein EL18_00227 [Nitratireductor basaltis]|uniref:Uncharacterized protein n=1 Tax=Nitratireductor basaltis TaxID=472175 RepID=A0A084U8C6_9HYPH|nr:hypothetical protein EL18_00227 [Nitratireductor basaltis]
MAERQKRTATDGRNANPHRDTPPVVVMRRGRSPGLRVIAPARLPALSRSGMMDRRSPPTVAGAAAD